MEGLSLTSQTIPVPLQQKNDAKPPPPFLPPPLPPELPLKHLGADRTGQKRRSLAPSCILEGDATNEPTIITSGNGASNKYRGFCQARQELCTRRIPAECTWRGCTRAHQHVRTRGHVPRGAQKVRRSPIADACWLSLVAFRPFPASADLPRCPFLSRNATIYTCASFSLHRRQWPHGVIARATDAPLTFRKPRPLDRRTRVPFS